MKIERISASAFETECHCQFQYFLRYVCGFEDKSIPSGLIGSIAHHVLEILSRASIANHDKNSKIWDIEYLWKICLNYYYNKEPEVAGRIKEDKLMAVCKGLHELISSPYTPIRNNTISAEQYFKIEMPGKIFKLPNNKQLFITGKIDRIDKIDKDTIEICDYKTGMRKKFLGKSNEKRGSEDMSKEVQVQMYYLAAKTLYPQYKNVLINFYFLTDGGSIPIMLDDSDLPNIRQRLANKFKEILNNESPKRNRGWHCNAMCTYGKKTGICDSVWQELEEDGFNFTSNKYVVLNFKTKK